MLQLSGYLFHILLVILVCLPDLDVQFTRLTFQDFSGDFKVLLCVCVCVCVICVHCVQKKRDQNVFFVITSIKFGQF